ncbi:MAG TPA: hypothetical protein VGK05_01945, partial [Acidimicrobiia bacterium]
MPDEPRWRDWLRIRAALQLFALRHPARAAGAIRRWWSRSGTVRAIFGLSLLLGLALVIEAARNSWDWSWPSWESFGYALLPLLVVAFVRAASRSQRQIVSAPFEDHLHDQPSPAVSGIPALLRQEVARLRLLYGPPPGDRLAVDVSVSPRGRDLDVTGTDISEEVQEVVAADSKLSIGFLSIPLAPAIGTLARFLRGPRIRGSVHREGADLVVTAELRRRDGVHTWFLRCSNGEDEDSGVAALTRQLADRVVGLVIHGPTVGPETIGAFHRGLAHYYDAVRNPASKERSLRLARNELHRAAGRDPMFGWAAFNLSLVYQELAELEPDFFRENLLAASRYLDQACETDPRKWEFRHARCVVARDQPDPELGLLHGQAAAQLAAASLPRAKSSYQVGLLLGRQRNSARHSVIVQRRTAARWSRRAVLSSASFDRGDHEDANWTAASALVNLGVACAYTADVSQGAKRRRWAGAARRALRLAADLRRGDANLRLEQAKIETGVGRTKYAVEAAERCVALDPSRLAAWAFAAGNHGRLRDEEQSRRCVSELVRSPIRALTRDESINEEPLRYLAEIWRAIEDPPSWLNDVRTYFDGFLQRWDGLSADAPEALEDRAGGSVSSPPSGWPDLSRWEQALAHVRLAHEDHRPSQLNDEEWHQEKVSKLSSAIDLLDETWDDDILYLGLHSAIADVSLKEANRALTWWPVREEALKAVRKAPFDETA